VLPLSHSPPDTDPVPGAASTGSNARFARRMA
jgi:hypothetical protein